MTKAGIWVVIGCAALGACAESQAAGGDWAAECLALRPLEMADEGQLFCGSEIDDGLDGDVDQRVNVEYDDNGRAVVFESDLDEYSERRYEYDDDGRLLWRELYGQDGELAFREAHRYATGSLVRDELDLDGDGEVDVVSTYDYSCLHDGEGDFDPSGRSACSVDHDIDNDGDVDRMSTTVRGDDGYVLERIEYHPATGATTRTTFDDGTGDTRVEEDLDSDGTIDVVSGNGGQDGDNYEWRDEDADGMKDWWKEYSADDGLLVVERDREGEISHLVFTDRDHVQYVSYRNARHPEQDYDSVTWLDALGDHRGSARDERPFGSADSCSYAVLCEDER